MAASLEGSWKLKLGVVLAVAGVWYWGHARKDARLLLTTKPRRGDLARVIREEARTRYRVTHTVSLPFQGRLIRHDLEEGDAVVAGQVLARLQSDLVESALESSQKELAALRQELELVQDVSDDAAAVTQAEARIKASEAAVEAAKDEVPVHQAAKDLAWSERQRIRDLSERGAATKAQVDQVDSEFRRANGLLEVARSRVAAAQAEVEAARAALAQAETNLRSQATREAQLQARIASLQARLVPLEDNMSRREIRAPISGEVLAVYQRSEAVLAPGTPLFELGDPGTLEVEVDLLSEDAVHIRPGGLYGVYGRALDDAEVAVDLREVSPRAFTKRSSLGVEEQRVHAWFTFRKRPEGLGHGYRVHLRAALEVARGADLIPRRALLRQGKQWGAFVAQGGAAELVTLVPGIGDESWVEVREGLPRGATLLLDVPETLEDGDPVTTQEAIDLPDPAGLPGVGPPAS